MLFILLLRKETILILKQFLRLEEGVLLTSGDESERPAKGPLELLQDALSWPGHLQKSWRLISNSRGNQSGTLAKSNDIRAIARSCEWCLMPWGTDYPGLMVALISSDDDLTGQVIKALTETDSNELLVSRYDSSDIVNCRFRGAVFSSDSGPAAEAVWGLNDCPTVLAFTAGGGDISRKRLEGAELLAEEAANDPETGIKVARTWLRILDVDAMRFYARHAYTSFFVGGINEKNLTSFFTRSREVGRDGLRLALAALESARWIYIPKTEAERDQIYIHQSSQATAKLFSDQPVTSAPWFILRCFC